MYTCEKCNNQLTKDEMASGRCRSCGVDLPPEMSAATMLEGDETAEKPVAEEVPVFTAEQAQQSMNPFPLPGTVASEMDWSKISAMTSEAHLPPSLRSIVAHENDKDDDASELRLNLMHTVDSDLSKFSEAESEPEEPRRDSSSKIDLPSGYSKVPVAARLADPEKPAAEPSSRKADGGSGSSNLSGSQSTDSQLNIPNRKIALPGTPEAAILGDADYKVIRPLGAGGMGEVWLAHQTSLNREVALKKIKSDSASRKSEGKMRSARHSFLAEAVVTGDLNHPNIVPVYDMGIDAEGELLYSMKCVRGISWDRKIRSFSQDENLEILRKVADAIGFSHSRGIVHRDLKPSNIMVGAYGEVQVMDWGTAFPLSHFSKVIGKESISSRAGTPAYMPPEQARGDLSDTGPHSDVYLLGAILFEIVSGRPPHPTSTETGQSLTRTQLLENAITNRIVDTTASGELLEIALKAMKTRPKDRYPNVDAFIEALKSYQTHAESIVLSNQAKKDLEAANASGDYSVYARALYGFENALKLWEQNYDAINGLVDTRVDYGTAALKKENFDLGLSLVNDDHPKCQPVYRSLLAAQSERRKKDGRLKLFKKAVYAAVSAVVIVSTGAAILVNQARVQEAIQKKIAEDNAVIAQANAEEAKKQTLIAQDNAIKAEKSADEAREQTQIAEENAEKAQKSEAIAVEQTQIAKENEEKALKNEKAAIAAQIEADMKRAEADAARVAQEKASAKALREWYFSQIGLADQQVAQNAFESAREILHQVDEQLDKDKAAGKTDSLTKEIGWEFKRLKFVCGLGDDKLVHNANNGDSIALTSVAAGNEFLATANRRGEIDIWNASGKRDFVRAIKSPGQPSALAFSPNGKVLAVGNTNGLITLWDPKTGEGQGELEKSKEDRHKDEVTRLLYLPEGELISTSRDHTARVWNTVDRTFVELKGHSDGIRSLARVANKKDETIGLLTGDSNQGEVRFWKWPVSDVAKSQVTIYNDSSAIRSLAAQLRGENEDLLVAFVGTENGGLKAVEHSLNPKSGRKNLTYDLARQPSDRHKGSVTRLLIDPVNPNKLISSSQDNTIKIWNIAQAAITNSASTQSLLTQTLRGHGNGVVDAAVWKDEESGKTRLLTASSDGSARFWRPDEYAEVVSLGGETLNREAGAYGEVMSVSVGNHGERIMGISTDGVATIWNVANVNGHITQSQPIPLKEGHRFVTQSATFFKDKLVTVSFDGTAVVWDRDTGSMIDRWRDVGNSGVLAGSADGRWVITGYVVTAKKGERENKPNLQVWSLAEDTDRDRRRTIFATGKAVMNENNNKVDLDQPYAAAFSPDNQYALVGTDNGYLSLIDFRGADATTAPVMSSPLEAHVGAKDGDSQAPDGIQGVGFISATEAVSVGLDGNLRFWVIQDGKLVSDPARKTFVHLYNRAAQRVLRLAVSADGTRVATLIQEAGKEKHSDFRQIWVMDIQSDGAKPVAKLQPWGSTSKTGESAKSLSITADGSRVMAIVERPGTSSGAIQTPRVVREWDLTAGNEPAPKDVLKSAKGFNFDQASYLSGGANEIAILSDTVTTIRNRTAEGGFGAAPIAAYGPTLALQACSVSSDGKLAVTISDSLEAGTDRLSGSEPRLTGEIRVWDIKESVANRVGHLNLNGAIRTVAMSPRENDVVLVAGNLPNPDVAGEYSAELYRWNGKELILSQRLGSHKKGIVRSRFSADGNTIVTASVDGKVEVFQWNGMTFKPASSFNLAAKDRNLSLGELITVDLSDDGTLVVAADKTSALVVSAASGEPVIDQLIQGHSNDLTDVRFASRPQDNPGAPQRLWTTSLDGTVKFWGIGTPDQNVVAKKDGEGANGVADDAEKNIARLLLTLRGHQRGVLSLAAMPNGGVVTAGKDGQIILWPIVQPN